MKRWNVYYWEWPENDNDSIWIWWDCSWFLTNIQCIEIDEIILIHQIRLKIHVITTEFCFFFEKTTGNISVWSYLIQVFFLLLSINSKRVFYEIILQVCLCCLFVKLGMSIFDLAREVISTVSQIFVFLGTPPFYKYKF